MTISVPVAAPRGSLLLEADAFEHVKKAGKVLAMSAMFPAHLKDPKNADNSIANGILVLDMASRMNEHPLMIAQSIYFVSGKPGWDAKFMIAKANQAKVFDGRIRWRSEGQGESLKVTAFAKMKDDGEEVTASTSMEMAKAEGWTKNSKYQSMPEQMLRYRSATFLVRLYCPEVMLGLPMADEIEDVQSARDITPLDLRTEISPQEAQALVEDAEVVEDDANPKAKKASPRPKTEPVVEEESEGPPDHIVGLVKRIVGDLNDLSDHAEIQATLDMFVEQFPQIEQLWPEGMTEIKEAREEAEARADQKDEAEERAALQSDGQA